MQMVAINPPQTTSDDRGQVKQVAMLRPSDSSLYQGRPTSAYQTAAGIAMNPNLVEAAQFANIMVEFDQGRKEMAVDVPDTFIAHVKTPPKFPSSIGQSSMHSSRTSSNSLGTKASSTSSMGSRSNGSGASRSRTEVSVSVLPDVRISRQTTTSSVDKLDYTQADKRSSTPKQQPLPTECPAVNLKRSQRIKDYIKDIKTKQTLIEKQNRNNEFMRLSMRNSQKFKRLMEDSGGVAEAKAPPAYAPNRTANAPSMVHLVTALQRLESIEFSGKSNVDDARNGLKHALNMSQEVILSPEFQRAHRLQEKIKTLQSRPYDASSPVDPLFPSTLDAISVLGAAVHALYEASNVGQAEQRAYLSPDHAQIEELTNILTGRGNLFESMMLVHDQISSIRLETASNYQGTEVTSANKFGTSDMNDDVDLFRQMSRYTEPNIKIIRIDKSGSDPLGATVRNDDDAVIVARIMRGGTAEASGLLHVGDELLEVNEIPLRGKSVNEVSDLLSSMVGPLTFLVVPVSHHLFTSTMGNSTDAVQTSTMTPTEPDGRSVHAPGNVSDIPFQSPTLAGHIMPVLTSILHIKALIDYDAEDDPYLPCKELGISYRKGDILHVLNQSDGNWWQARREGEDDELFHSLPGLIPSPSFQEQREALKIALARDAATLGMKQRRKGCDSSTSRHGTTSSRGRQNKKSRLLLLRSINGTLGFGGAHKRRASMTFSPYFDPSDMLVNEDDVPMIATYEQVALYYPRSDRKRPIVLIGPPNIGRHDLRQRLMMDTTRFAAAIPHTSRPRRPDEMDGVDYHFISRVQFEQDIMARKFVEHGEYEKAYYGTSFDAIRRVADDENKICVLNLHPESLAALRQPIGLSVPQGQQVRRHLMPFVVFVAPPSVEKLRQCRIERGETAGMSENELRETVERARAMEATYGHLFDMIIVYNDVNSAYVQLVNQINHLEREPQWVPAGWLPM